MKRLMLARIHTGFQAPLKEIGKIYRNVSETQEMRDFRELQIQSIFWGKMAPDSGLKAYTSDTRFGVNRSVY